MDATQTESEREHFGSDTAGLTLTRESAASAVAHIDLDGRTASQLNRELATASAFQEHLVAAIGEVLDGHTPAAARERLRDLGVTVLDGLYADLCLDVARGDTAALWDLLAATRTLGSGQTPFDLRSSTDDLLAAHTRLLAAADRTPTVVVRIREGFRDQRADQRRDVCRYLTALAQGCDVRVVGTGLQLRWLTGKHRGDLPAQFSEDYDPRCARSPFADVVETAQETIDPDSREVRILRLLADEETGTLPYSALCSEFAVTRGRISQCLGTLEGLDLAARYQRGRKKYVEIQPAGEDYLGELDVEIGRQQRLDEPFSETGGAAGQNPHHHRVTQREDGEGDHRPAGAATDVSRYRVRYLARRDHHAAAASAPENGIATVERPIERRDCGGDAWVSYAADREELVISAEFNSALQYTVCLARALADGRVRSTALTESDLDDLLADADRDLLRDARQLGWLSKDVRDGADYWGEFTDARETLLDLTYDLHQTDDPDDTSRLRGEIMRLAHGLAGVIVHALDRVGVDVVREVRIPNYRKCNQDDRETVAKTLEHTIEVQSRYGEFAAFRQLIESREDKRRTAMSPSVDAADPRGTFIGSMTIVGPRTADLADRLQDRLETRDHHEDAPEFTIPYPFDVDPGRPAVADAVERMCREKDLRPSRAATSVIDALVESPYAAADAIHALEAADYRREIRLDEVRYALASLPTDAILPDAKPTVRAILRTLLRADVPLDTDELADRADVSKRSIRRHTDTLAALDLVRETDAGYRVALPFADERGDEILPRPACDRLTTATDTLEAVARVVVDDEAALREARRLADPGDRLRALAGLDAVGLWVSVATALAAATIEADPPPRDTTTAAVGPTPEQTPVPTATAGEPA